VSDTSDHDRLFAEFDALCDLPEGEQAQALERLRTEDEDLAAKVAALLDEDSSGEVASPLTNAVWQAAESALEPDRTGEKLGRFVLLDRLGQGGMGVVYSAFDNELERRVAIKLIRSPVPDDREQRRLLREAKAMAKLAHPNVVPVFDAGAVGEDVFIAMEYVKGQTLREWVRDGAGDWRTIVTAYAAAAAGLAAAHEARLVHRDFKPDNVLVGEDRRPRVLDFGVARPLSDAPDAGKVRLPAATSTIPHDTPLDKLTGSGAVLGTPGYMAPEQFEALPTDHRTDQFAFCVSLYEALYGQRPFAGSTFGAIYVSVREGAVQPAPTGTRVPSWLREVILRGLSVSPNERWPSMEALREQLLRDPARTRRRWLLVGLGITLVGAAVWGGSQLGGEAPTPCRDAAHQLEEVWNAQQRRAVAALPGSGAEVAATLDAYAQAWVSGHTDACEATHIRGEQSTEMMDLRMRCLTRRKRELSVLVENLRSGDPSALLNPLARARGLSPVEPCANPEYVLAQSSAPKAEPDRDTAQLREELAAAKSCLVAYREPDFRGQSWIFCHDDDPPIEAWNEAISSVRVPPGHWAQLCTEPEAKGRCTRITSDTARLAGDSTVGGSTIEGFDDRVSSVRWGKATPDAFSLLIVSGRADEATRGSATWLASAMDPATAVATLVEVPDTLGVTEGRAAFVDTWMTDTGVHLWPLATEMPTPSCFEGDCATALVRFLHGWIRAGQPLRYDGRETQDYGVLTRAREITGSLAYSHSISGYRIVVLHGGVSRSAQQEQWNGTDALVDRVTLKPSLDWLTVELALARREFETVVLFVGEIDDTLADAIADVPDVAAVFTPTPDRDRIGATPVYATAPGPDASFRRVDFGKNRITVYGVSPGEEQPRFSDVDYIDIPRGYRRATNAAIRAHNDRILDNYSTAECARACDEETEFECRSFDYDPTNNSCKLSKTRSGEIELKWNYPPYSLYERIEATEEFEVFPNAAIAGHNTRHLAKVTVSECLAACVAETEFECASVDYDRHQNLCDLSDASKDETGLKRLYPPYDHFARAR